MRKLLPIVAIVIVGLTAAMLVGCSTLGTRGSTPAGSAAATASTGDAALARAFADKASKLEVEGSGTVTRILADDNDGARHQRFIIRLHSGQALLVAHNIDIAPRVAPLNVGDAVSFKGEYAWNSQGGVIHWTHHDPSGSHEAGWIKRGETVYQ